MIKKFIDGLSKKVGFSNIENQYADCFEYSYITKANLQKYLEIMFEMEVKTLLVGEAPGYNGCRWSGIPFTAEKNVTLVYIQNKLFGIKNGFNVRDINNVQTETSATIVWSIFNKTKKYPLMWNAFPFHPYSIGKIESNRKPNSIELQYGKTVLLDIIKIFKIENIIAVGNTSHKILLEMGIKCKKIRHPAHGGKVEFENGIIREI